MRIDVIKYLIVGPSRKKDVFFEKIQPLGIAEFINPNKEAIVTPPQDVQAYVEALHILRRRPPVKQSVPSADYRSAIVLARHILDRNSEVERLREQIRILEKEISRIHPFGNFSVSQLRQIEEETHRKVQFFFAKATSKNQEASRPEVIWINSVHELDYFMTINKEATTYPGMVEILIEKSLDELEAELAFFNRKIDEYEAELSSLAHQQKLLKQGLMDALNHYHLQSSKDRVESALDGGIFAVEAWIPKNKIDLLESVSQENAIYVEPIKVEPTDRIPTYLENTGISRLGEDLIGIYDTPSSSDRDPSLWVFLAFGLFFAMIVADAGYGLLLLGISLFLYYRFGKKATGLGRRILKLSLCLSFGCIVWGILSASYLGINVPLDSPLRKVSLTDWMAKQKAAYLIKTKGPAYEEILHQFPSLKDVTNPQEFIAKGTKEVEGKVTTVVHDELVDNVLLELVLFIGAIHVILGLIRYLDKNWAGLGWILFIIGSYLYFPSVLKAVSLIHYIFHIPAVAGAEVGLYLLFGGIGLASVLAIIQKRLGGLAEVTLVIGVFADIMSYLRIYALSLAGMVMATTFNRIASSAPLYAGIFILLGGHSVNFVLALMGGIIHGLRLNFIEWYHHSFEGGGKPFKPLSLFKIE